MFDIGMQVICIDDSNYAIDDEKTPVKGSIYTIRAIEPFPDGVLTFLLEEIVNDVREYEEGITEASFYAWRFRPVRKTSIEVFTEILAPSDREREVV